MKINRFSAFVLCAAFPLLPIAARAKEKPLQVSKENFVSLSWSRTEIVRVVPDSSIFSQGTLPRYHTIASSYSFENQFLQYNRPERFDVGGSGGVGGGGGGGFPSYSFSSPPSVPMSQNQWGELLARLKMLDLPSIAGRYEQKDLTEGTSEALTLTISDADNVDQTFTLSTSGNRAPASYAKFSDYISTLIARKFHLLPQPTPATSPTPAAPN